MQMKRHAALFLSILLLLTMTACGGKTAPGSLSGESEELPPEGASTVQSGKNPLPGIKKPGGKDPEGKGSGSEDPHSPAAVDAGVAPGEDPISQSGPAPVSVRYLEPERDHTPYWVTLYDGPEAEFALFTTDSAVEEFTLWTLSAEDYTETGAVLFSSIQVFLEPGLDSLPEVMTPDTPVAVQLVFWGDTPGYGISYVDENGTFRRFILSQSGYDGSLLLEEVDPLEADFVLPGAVSR